MTLRPFASTSRTCPSVNGSIIRCSRAMWRIQRSDLMDIWLNITPAESWLVSIRVELVSGAGYNWALNGLRRDVRLHRHPGSRIRIRLEARSAPMGLSTPPAAGPPEAAELSGVSPNFVTTTLDFLTNWARSNSLWPMPFGTACCAIEFMATAASRYDFARFGMERQAFSPRQADVLICAGRLPFKLAPVIRRVYDQMPQPKWVISMGACASTGGIFDNYAMVQGIDTIVPVDVYVPGCPPRPEGLLYGVLLLHKKIKGETVLDPELRREQPLDDKGLRLPPERIDEISEPFGNSVHQFRSA